MKICEKVANMTFFVFHFSNAASGAFMEKTSRNHDV